MSVEKLFLELNQVRSEFQAWRAAKTGRERIPENLWSAAITLLNFYPIKIVCKELRLNAKQLRKRREGINQPPTQPKRRGKGQFLELTGRSLINTNSLANNTQELLSPQLNQSICQLLLEKKDGSRLTISLPMDWTRMEALCANLLKA